MIRDLSINEILTMIAKIIGAISLSSLVYSFCKNISMADIKIGIAFLKAKFFGLLDSDYKITYTSKYGFKLEKEIQYFLMIHMYQKCWLNINLLYMKAYC